MTILNFFFLGAVDVVFNAADIGTRALRPLIVQGGRGLVGSIDEAVKTFQI